MSRFVPIDPRLAQRPRQSSSQEKEKLVDVRLKSLCKEQKQLYSLVSQLRRHVDSVRAERKGFENRTQVLEDEILRIGEENRVMRKRVRELEDDLSIVDATDAAVNADVNGGETFSQKKQRKTGSCKHRCKDKIRCGHLCCKK